MTQVINLQRRREEKNFDTDKEPCEHCPPRKKSECSTTCDKADNWWKIFAKKYIEGTLSEARKE